jgi:hypothetical protein
VIDAKEAQLAAYRGQIDVMRDRLEAAERDAREARQALEERPEAHRRSENSISEVPKGGVTRAWRSRGRKKKRTQPALASAIVTPAPMKKRRQMMDGQELPQRSAIVEPKKRRNTML